MDFWQNVEKVGWSIAVGGTLLMAFIGITVFLIRFLVKTVDTLGARLDKLTETAKCNVVPAQLDKLTDAMNCVAKKLQALLVATYLKAAGQGNPRADDLWKVMVEGEEPPACPPEKKKEAKAA